jgi:anti-sigma factor RsiW
MTCDRSQSQLYLYLDSELAAPEAAEFEQHVQACRDCESAVAAHRRLQRLLQETLAEEPDADALWQAVEQRLPDEPAEPAGRRYQSLLRRLLRGGAWAAAALALLALGLRLWLAPAASDVAREIVDSQIRAQLMHAGYEQVPQDANAVRRWFDGKVEFAPPVPFLSQSGYDLVGVRLNYFLNRRVAEMAYTAEGRAVSFLTFSDKDISLHAMKPVRLGDRTFHVRSYKGYNTVLWQDGEIFCSLVSALQLSELLRIAGQATGSLPAS